MNAFGAFGVQGAYGSKRTGGLGEWFLRVHWVAVPEALRARRVNRRRTLGLHHHRRHPAVRQSGCFIEAPCPPLTSHGASICAPP
jgi:hypothetical protein